MPRPGSVSKPVTGRSTSRRFSLSAISAWERGCSDGFSREAASLMSSSPDSAPARTRSVTAGLPSVMVPVLSSTTAFTWWAVSRASADLMRMPFFAPTPVPTIIEVGVARPRAQGQEMTSTEIAAFKAAGIPCPASIQMMNASTAILMTTGTKMPLILSASLAIGALVEAASSISRMIWERVVSSPTSVASKTR